MWIRGPHLQKAHGQGQVWPLYVGKQPVHIATGERGMLPGVGLDSLAGQVFSGLRYKWAGARMTVVFVNSNTTGTTDIAGVAELDENAHAGLVGRSYIDAVTDGALSPWSK